MTLQLRAGRRLVRESNPSHSIDSGTATPVASRGNRCRKQMCSGQEFFLPRTMWKSGPSCSSVRARAPAGGIEPPRRPLNRRRPDHSASLEKSRLAAQREAKCIALRGRAFVRPIFIERGACHAVRATPSVPGTGFEPVSLDSETSVLPARRSRRVAAASDQGRARRSSRSGGTRTLTTSIKSRVRLPIALRTQEHAPRETAPRIRARARSVGREGVAPSSLGGKGPGASH